MAMLKEYQRHKEEFLHCAKDLDEMTALRDAWEAEVWFIVEAATGRVHGWL